MCVIYCIYIWLSHPQNKQVGLVLIPEANCTFCSTCHQHSYESSYSVSRFKTFSYPPHTHTHTQKHTLYFSIDAGAVFPPGLSLLPNPEWKGQGGSQMLDVWMPINWCLSLLLPALAIPHWRPPFACIMAPGFLFPLSHPPSSRERLTERVKDMRGTGVRSRKKGALQSEQEKEKIKRQTGGWDVCVW